MTLCEIAVRTLVLHGFDATQGANNSSFIIVKFEGKKVVLHHMDIYSFLNKYDSEVEND